MSEWISVKDRLPEEGKDVNVFGKIGWYGKGTDGKFAYQVGTARICEEITPPMWSTPTFCSGIESELDIYDITHWMELPKPPIGEQ